MPIPQNKEELLQAIHVNYSKLCIELESIPEQLTNEKNLPGHAKGTFMSINNLLSYLIGWGQLVLKWHYQKSNQITTHFPEEGYQWNMLGQLAQKFYQDFENDNYTVLQEKLAATTQEIIDLIETKSNEELYGTPWYDKWTLGRMIQLNTAAPFKNAKDRIRKWKKENK
jgi:hypothetical protein